MEKLLCLLGFHAWHQREYVAINPNFPDKHLFTLVQRKCMACGKIKIVRVYDLRRRYEL